MIIKKHNINIAIFVLLLSFIHISLVAQNAQNDTTTTFTNVAKIIDVRANDTINETYITSDYCLNIAPQHGTIEVLNQDSIRYIPDFDFTGTDEFVYGLVLASDSCSATIDTARVTVQIENSGLTLLANWDEDTLAASGIISYNDIWGYTDCNGNEYAIMGSLNYVHFFDLKEDNNPKEIAAIEGGSRSLWRDMKTYRDRAYSVADSGNEGLLVFDLSNLPERVSLSNQIKDDFTRSHNIFIDEPQGRLYVVGSDGERNGLIVYDLTQNPDTPTLLAKVSLSPFFNGSGGYVHDVFVRENMAYCSHGSAGLYVYDLKNLDNPILLGSLDGYLEDGYNHASWLSDDGNYLVFADETHNTSLKMVDVHDLEDMTLIDLFRSTNLGPNFTNSIAHNPFIRGQYVIASYYHDGIQIFDMSNPESVEKVAFYDTEPNNVSYLGSVGAWGVYPFLPSGRIIGSDVRNGLMVLAANDIVFDSINRPMYPELSSVQVEDKTLCEGDSLTLDLPEGASSFLWSNGEEQFAHPNLTISKEGNYTIAATNEHCVQRLDTFMITVDTMPNVSLEVMGSTEICEDENVILQIIDSNTTNYSWLQDEIVLEVDTTALLIQESGTYQLAAINGVCMTRSEEVEVLVSAYPDVNLEIDGDLNFCEDTILQISVPEGAEIYQWLQNGVIIEQATTHQFNPTASGTYTLMANNHNCVSESESVEVLIDTLPNASLDIIGATEICEDESVTLQIEDANTTNYNWLKDEMVLEEASSTLLIQESGVYQLLATNGACTAQSSEVAVIASTYPNVDLEITGEVNFCPEDILQIAAPQGADAYQWLVSGSIIEQATTHQFNPTASGTYTLIANNRNCVSESDSIDVTVFEVDVPFIILDENNILFSTEAVAYQWYLNQEAIEGATEQTYVALNTGTYWVETTSAEGCVAISNLQEVSLANVHEVYLKTLAVYPNPVQDILYLVPQYINNQNYNLVLHDMTGKLILKKEGRLRDNQKIRLDVGGLPTGVYILQFLGEQVQLTQRVMIR